MDVRLLGPLSVVDDAGVDRTPAGVKERTLLARLALHPRTPISADSLAETLWGGEIPRNPSNALQARVSALRRSLGDPAMVVARPPGYQLELEPDRVDVVRFERSVKEARAAAVEERPGRAMSAYRTALEEWRGDALADFAFLDFARHDIERLEELRLAATEELLGLMVDHGRHTEALGLLEALVEDQPLRERLWGLLMLALYRSGRQADALRAYGRAAQVLGEELGIEPSTELQQLEEAMLLQDPGLDSPSSAGHRRGNLPARPSSFLGRQTELEEIGELLEGNRLVTLTGPGGVGKTSLAVEAARQVVDEYTGGTWMVELAAIEDPALVPDALARSLGLHATVPHGSDHGPDPAEMAAAHLRGSEALLVLDNCEHVVEASASLADRLLRAVPGLRILATSREPLRAGGEVAWSTPPLTAPSGEIDPAKLVSYDAVSLFVERARAANPAFELDETNAAAVSLVCSQLDGLPLALELAASRVRTLPVRELAARLHDRFRLLASGDRTAAPRQRTLRAAIDWSHDLLGPTERALFRRLAVFSGGWTLPAAERVCSDEDSDSVAVMETLSVLVDRSLVEPPSSTGRYRTLETIREYAEEQLEAAGEGAPYRRRHLRHHLELVEDAPLRGPEQTVWVRRFDEEIANLRTALGWASASGQHDLALRLAAGLGWYWFFDRIDEGKDALDAVLAAAPVEPSIARGRALLARAMVVFDLSPEPAARAAARESMRMLDVLGDVQGAAEARCLVALDGWFGQDPEESLRLLTEAGATFEAAGDVWGRAFAEFVEMLVRFRQHDDMATAAVHGRRSIELFEETGDPWALTAVPAHLGEVLRWSGDIDGAIAAQTRALEAARSSALPHVAMYCLHELGQLAALAGHREAAVGWLERGLEEAEGFGHRFWTAAFGLSLADAIAREDPARARSLYADAERESRAQQMFTGRVLAGIGELTLAEGDLEEAVRVLVEGATIARVQGDPPGLLRCLTDLVSAAGRRDQQRWAARLWGAATALRERTGIALSPGLEPEAHLDAARRRLGDGAYAAATREGADLPLEVLLAAGD